jgi:alkyldihydroxyacetonephosphate synthase
MRRWNGWGDHTVELPLPSGIRRLLEERVGPSTPPRDVPLEEVCAAVPTSRLPHHPLVSTDGRERVLHSRGQSLPDWVALRSGRIDRFTDGVAHPASGAEVRRLLDWAGSVGARVVPYGGGTSVVGHLTPDGEPTLTMVLRGVNGLRRLDETSGLATFGAGASGPEVESSLRARGWTLGHYPQSFEYSTLGGWVVTRSAGQQSLCFGRIEDLFAGGCLETPTGTLTLPPLPASAAGPDLRELVLGSEGRLGVLTEAIVRVTRLPSRERFPAVFFRDWDSALAAVRAVAQAGVPLSMLRLSNAEETRTSLELAGPSRALGLLRRALHLRGVDDGMCLLLAGVTGDGRVARAGLRELKRLSREHGGVHVGGRMGRRWVENRFRAPYLRNSLWELGYAVDTLETALPWSGVSPLVEAIEAALRAALGEMGERIHVFTHLSHAYSSGSSIYTTFVFRLAPDPAGTLVRWGRLKEAASRAILEHGGTISHQHGVGTDHRPYLEAEKGVLGMSMLRSICRDVDPDGLMNPGKLVP